jgi:cytochrome c553
MRSAARRACRAYPRRPIHPAGLQDLECGDDVGDADAARSGLDRPRCHAGAALRICHGPQGVSDANSPNLAGQFAAVTYKELVDFKTGARVNVVMSPFAANLSNQDMLDVAAYYAYLPRVPSTQARSGDGRAAIVTIGAPMRNIAPCGSCHGDIDNKAGSPWLGGQSAVYIKAQLQAFAAGTRRNDISQQMRNIAAR